ncbi:MAG: hypothetical protein JNG89_02490, partial [Planctomycetaceae bacterium]|nr:hypothetical protein [Planctomycetaceae bacterium]
MAVSSVPSSRFPQSVTWTVVLLCATPPLLNLFGVSFGARLVPFDPRDYSLLDGPLQAVFVFALL